MSEEFRQWQSSANPTEPEREEIQTRQTKCPSCGANMAFDPESQALRCPYCDATRELPKGARAAEIDLLDGIRAGQGWQQEARMFECVNCSAKVVLEAGETAKRCPFCGAGNIVPSEEMAGVKPNGVLPFLLTAEQASEACRAWAKKKLFSPRKFKKTISPENVSGVYTPTFTFDSKTVSTYEGRFGERYTVTVPAGKGKTRTETRIRYYHVSGTYNRDFDDVMIYAGGRVDAKDLGKLRPFDTNNGAEYRAEYLSGFMASHYERPVEEMWEEAKGEMDSAIRSEIISGYKADVVSYLNVSTVHENATYKYVLLPVYVGNYTFRKKLYNFFVNGTNGKTRGKAPISVWRVLAAVLLGAAVVTGVVLLALL